MGVVEHDGDVRFKSESGNMAVSCMRNASGHTYSNSPFIVDLAVGKYHVPQNVFLVNYYYQKANAVVRNPAARVTDTTQHLNILRSL